MYSIDLFLSEIEESQNDFLESAILDDKLHRFGKKEHAWYIGNNDFITIGSWKFGVKKTFNLKNPNMPISNESKIKSSESAIQQGNENFRFETKEKSIWFFEKGNNEQSLYLSKKKITSNFGAKTKDNGATLLVPIYDLDGFHSLQIIKEDSTKLFLKHTHKKSSFYILNTKESDFLQKIKEAKILLLTEGFATGCSIQMAFPNQLIACSFDCGNIIHVVDSFLKVNPKLIIILCGDRDFKSKAGEKAIIETNNKYPKNTIMLLPSFKAEDTKLSDYNDLHCRYGIERVRDQISMGLLKYMIFL